MHSPQRRKDAEDRGGNSLGDRLLNEGTLEKPITETAG
jgi:hypothetical protein